MEKKTTRNKYFAIDEFETFPKISQTLVWKKNVKFFCFIKNSLQFYFPNN